MGIALRKPDWTISDGTLSFIKWLAIVCMVIDHFNLYYLYPKGLHQYELYQIGRLAAPLFAVMVGYNLARPGSETTSQIKRAKKMATLLLAFGVLSYPIDLFVAPIKTFEPNILISFLIAVIAVIFIMAIRSRPRRTAVTILLYTGVFIYFLIFGGIAEYRFSVTTTVILTFLLAGAKTNVSRVPLLILLVGSLMTFTQENQSMAGLFALLILGLALVVDLKMPKGPRLFFYAFYPIHQLILSATSMIL